MPAAEPSELVLQTDERPFEQWDDERGRLAFATLFGSESTATDALTTGLAVVPPGGSLAVHRHTAVETYYVIAGEADLTLDGELVRLLPGTTVLLPSNIWHGVRNDGPEPLRVFYTFAVGAMSDVVYEFAERS
jgi:quercetin dioxygenase-like cupin family protein